MFTSKDFSNPYRVVARLEYRDYMEPLQGSYTAYRINPINSQAKAEILYRGNDETLAQLAINDELIRCS